MTTITCPACGFENDSANRFCNACGSELTPAMTAMSAPPTPPKPAKPAMPEPEVPFEYAPPMDAETAAELGAGLDAGRDPNDPVRFSPPPMPGVVPPPRYSPPPPPSSYVAGPALSTATGKSRVTALLLEGLPALLGIFGIGWMYSGQMTLGVILLVISIVVALFVGLPLFIFDIISLGVGLLFHIPLHLLCIVPLAIISAVALYFALRDRADLI